MHQGACLSQSLQTLILDNVIFFYHHMILDTEIQYQLYRRHMYCFTLTSQTLLVIPMRMSLLRPNPVKPGLPTVHGLRLRWGSDGMGWGWRWDKDAKIHANKCVMVRSKFRHCKHFSMPAVSSHRDFGQSATLIYNFLPQPLKLDVDLDSSFISSHLAVPRNLLGICKSSVISYQQATYQTVCHCFIITVVVK